MADAPKIQGTDTLRQAYPKLNSAIDNSNEAIIKAVGADGKASNAVTTAKEAKTKAESVQTQFDQVIIEGDSSVEAAQARVDAEGKTFNTLKDRLDYSDIQLAEETKKLDLVNWELKNKTRTKKPIVGFVDDDGKLALVTKLIPLADKYNFKVSAAIITSYEGNPNYVSKQQVKALHDAGHDILSHTHSHERMGDKTRAQQEYEMARSKEILESWGVTVSGMTFPERSYNDVSKELARKYFRFAGIGGFGINNTPIETYNLRSTKAGAHPDSNGGAPFPTNSLDYLKYRVDQAEQTGGWAIFGMHSGDTPDDQWVIIEQLIQYIQSKGIEIVTLTEGINRFGNVVDVGSYWKDQPYNNHFSLGFNGDVKSNYVTEKNAGEVQDVGLLLPQDFPTGYNLHYRIKSNNLNGIPGDPLGGTLITHALYDASDYMYQTYHPVNRNYIWKRARRSNTEWRDWEQFSPSSSNSGGGVVVVIPKNQATVDSGLTSGVFEKGKITYCEITNGPEGLSGMLVTNRLGELNSSHFQIFYTGINQYMRGYTGSAWQAFRKVTTTTISG